MSQLLLDVLSLDHCVEIENESVVFDIQFERITNMIYKIHLLMGILRM